MAILGLSCKLFRGEAGELATTEMTNVKNVTLSIEKGEADITTRAADGWKMFMATLKEASIEFEMVYDPADADFNAIQAAFFSDTPLAFCITDGVSNGLNCDCMVTKFDIDQSLEEAVTVSVAIKPTRITGPNGRAPKWETGLVISGGSITSGGSTQNNGDITSGGNVTSGGETGGGD